MTQLRHYLIVGQLSSALFAVNFSHLAAKVSESATTTLNFGKSESGLDASINVGVKHTQNVLEIGSHDERLRPRKKKKRETNGLGKN
jgi:hypothetical protein